MSKLYVAKAVFIEPFPEPELAVEDDIEDRSIDIVYDDDKDMPEPVSAEETAALERVLALWESRIPAYAAVADRILVTDNKTPGEILGGLMEVAVSP